MGFMSKRKHVKTNTYIYKHIDAQSPFISAYQVSCTNNVMKYYDFTLHRIIRNITITRKFSRHLSASYLIQKWNDTFLKYYLEIFQMRDAVIMWFLVHLFLHLLFLTLKRVDSAICELPFGQLHLVSEVAGIALFLE